MENAVDALKMAGAAALFIIAFSIAMTMFSRARTTTDAVLDNLNLEDFFQQVEPLSNNTTRIVGLETVIPTLYRYAQSDANIRIRILDSSGNEHQVFDQTLDQEVVEAARNHDPTSEYAAYFTYLRNTYDNKFTQVYLFQAPWKDQSDGSYRIERINAYINGSKTKHMSSVNYNSTQVGLRQLIGTGEGKFNESYVEYNISGQIEKDEYGEEIITKPASVKTIITYQLIN